MSLKILCLCVFVGSFLFGSTLPGCIEMVRPRAKDDYKQFKVKEQPKEPQGTIIKIKGEKDAPVPIPKIK